MTTKKMSKEQYSLLVGIKTRAANIVAFVDGFRPYQEELDMVLLGKLKEENETLGDLLELLEYGGL
jgi:hypothetical protein